MTIRYCLDCSEEYHTDRGFEIEIFNGSIFWCFECADKQLEIVDLKIKKMTSKDKTHKKVRFRTSKGYVSFKVRKSKQERMNKDFDLWEQPILKYLRIVRIPLTVREIARKTMMSWITCKKKLKGLELKGKVKAVKKGTRIKYEIKQGK